MSFVEPRLSPRPAIFLSVLATGLLTFGTQALARDSEFLGPLRARDLTPFGYLRLDMRPGIVGNLEPGDWAVETELAYQNTWALSLEVERYLDALPSRRELGAEEWAAIQALPGENYLLDMELAQLDVTLHRQLTRRLAAYVIVSGTAYGGGFLDSTIEGFHDAFGFSTFGRTGASRNDVNVLFDLKSMQYAAFESPTAGGMLDPTFGLRYSKEYSAGFAMAVEMAAKVPVASRRELLSTGRTDVGLQAALQKDFTSGALHVSGSIVYYDGSGDPVPAGAQWIPTLVLAYEQRIRSGTNAILQAYASPSIYRRSDTDLDELLATKYQLSLGIRHRHGPHLVTFAITENLQNLNNTPDIGFQFGWTYVPGWTLPSQRDFAVR